MTINTELYKYASLGVAGKEIVKNVLLPGH